MGRNKQPIAVVIAKGKKHLTKSEIEERQSQEIKPIVDSIEAPKYLTSIQKKEFNKLAVQLMKLGILGETDVDCLARYIIAQSGYVDATKKLRTKIVEEDPIKIQLWLKTQEMYFKQCRGLSADLGLTISSRCRLVVPEPAEKEEKKNKFSEFM